MLIYIPLIYTSVVLAVTALLDYISERWDSGYNIDTIEVRLIALRPTSEHRRNGHFTSVVGTARV